MSRISCGIVKKSSVVKCCADLSIIYLHQKPEHLENKKGGGRRQPRTAAPGCAPCGQSIISLGFATQGAPGR